ncbi:hypothetical protein RQN30_11050 [Arcanobacterium hippocoleae]
MKRIRFAGALALSFLLALPMGGTAFAKEPEGKITSDEHGNWLWPAGNDIWVYRGIGYSNVKNPIVLTSAVDKPISDVAVSAVGSASENKIINFNNQRGSKVTAFQGLNFNPEKVDSTGGNKNNAKLTITGKAEQYSNYKDKEAAFSAYFVYKSNSDDWTPNYPTYNTGEKFPASFFKLHIAPQNALFKPVLRDVELEQGNVNEEAIKSAVTVTLDENAQYDPQSVEFNDIVKAREAIKVAVKNASQLPGNAQEPQENSEQHNVSVTITYADKSVEDAIVKLTVDPRDSDDDGYTDYVEGLAKTNPQSADSVPAAPKVHAPTAGETLIVGEGIPTTQVTVILPDGQRKAVKVNGGGYWSYKLPAGTALELGQQVTVSDVSGRQTSAVVGKPTSVNPPVEGEDAVTGTGQPGTHLRVTVGDKNTKEAKKTVDTIVGDDGNWSALIGRGLEIGETVIVSQSYKVDIAKDVKAKESQNVTVSVVYNQLRADGGFEQIPGTGRTAVLSQPSLSADGSNLKVDLSGFEKVTVKGLPWKLTEVKFPAGITAVGGSSHVGEVDRHLEGDVVVHLLYEKAYASGDPLTQPEKPVLDPSELRQKVNVFVEYDVLRADGGFEQIPGTGRTAVLSQPALDSNGSNLKVDLSGFEKVTVKGLPWKLTEVKFPAGITAVDGSSRMGEVDRHLEGDVVIHLLYEKAYASGKPLTQPEKPKGEISVPGDPLIQPEKPKGEISVPGDPLIQPEKPKGEISVPGDPLIQPEKPVLDPDMVKTAKAPELSKTGAAVEGVLAGSLALIILGGAALTARRRMN